MSMFDLVIGNTGQPMEIMALVGLTPDMVGRYRDHWIEKGPDSETLVVAVYTRNGGGNRPEFEDQLSQMHALPTFISDDDDEFDATYCTLRFTLTKQAVVDAFTNANDVDPAWFVMLNIAQDEPRNMSNVWRSAIDSLAQQAGSS